MKISEIYNQTLNEVIIRESNTLLEDTIKFISESDLEGRTFEWDIVKDKIDKSKQYVKTTDQAKEYVERFLTKIKDLPKNTKVKLGKYVLASFVSVIGYTEISDITNDTAPDIAKEVMIEIPKKIMQRVTKKKYRQPTSVSPTTIELLKYEEGSIKHKGEPVLKAYKLGDGMITVGWGHAERINNSQFEVGQTIDRATAERLFNKDLRRDEKALNRLLKGWRDKGIEPKITQNMYDAMVSMIFNMGIGNFRGSEFIQLVKRGKFEEAKEKILTTNVTYAGHVTRRQREAELFGK